MVIEINITPEDSAAKPQTQKIYSLRKIKDKQSNELHLLNKKTCRPFRDKEYDVIKKHLHCDLFKRLKLVEDKEQSDVPGFFKSKDSKDPDKEIQV